MVASNGAIQLYFQSDFTKNMLSLQEWPIFLKIRTIGAPVHRQ